MGPISWSNADRSPCFALLMRSAPAVDGIRLHLLRGYPAEKFPEIRRNSGRIWPRICSMTSPTRVGRRNQGERNADDICPSETDVLHYQVGGDYCAVGGLRPWKRERLRRQGAKPWRRPCPAAALLGLSGGQSRGGLVHGQHVCLREELL